MSLHSLSKKNTKILVLILCGIAVLGLIVGAFFLGRASLKAEDEAAESESEMLETAKINDSVIKPKVSDFVFGDTSKIYITENGENKREITAFVTNYNGGDLCVNAGGLDAIFSLKETAMTEEDKETYLQKETEAGFASAGDEYAKFTDGTRNIVLKEGSKFYTVDGQGAVLSSAVTKLDGQLSVPIANLVFVFGYDSLGASANADSVTYTLIK